MKLNIRLIYLYLFSFVSLLVVVIGSIRMVELGMKVFVFPEADNYMMSAPVGPGEDPVMMRKNALAEQGRNHQRDFSGAVAMLAVGLPLYLYHWKLIQKEK
jgi:hypothetical protein